MCTAVPARSTHWPARRWRWVSLERAAAEARSVQAFGNRTQDGLELLGLSRRELEVLRLVSEGCTNRQVAEHLIVSQSTIKRHLDNVFGKLGVSSRAAAAAAALRMGLA